MRFFNIIFLTLFLSSCTQTTDELDQAKDAITQSYPNLPIENIRKVDENFFEVVIQGEIFYLSSDHKYFFAGNVIDVKTKENITETSRKGRRLSILETLKTENMIVYKPEKTDYVLTVFSDTSCPYCQKLHEELDKLIENNIEIRYILFPRFGQNSDAYVQMISIWCSEDQKLALDNVFDDKTIEQNTQCDNPMIENLDLAQKLSVTGTPMMFTENGTVIPGYQPADEIIKFLSSL
ncbi:MAG: DsbC family protein [Pseudomonadota bacterium]|nr:DsbC family protein [Pseudomonadota bacterium]